MLLKVTRSDRETSYYSPVENVQKAITEMYKDPTNFGVSMTVMNEDGVCEFFQYSESLTKREINEKLMALQNLLW